MSFDPDVMIATLGAWSLTYLVHSTALLALAAAAALALRHRPELEEAVWKTALVGGLLTATLQPMVTQWRPQEDLAAPVAAVALEVAETGNGTESAPFPGLRAEPRAPWLRGDAWKKPLLVIWLAVSAVLGARLLLASAALRRRLAGRATIGGPLARLVERLVETAGRRRRVQLTRSDRIPVPIALPAEICLPERALEELSRAEQESVVAHEMAHILRRDPAWLWLGRVLAAVLFFHPLVHLAGRRLRQIAELRCDDWAVGVTGRPLALARCLTRVAGWRGEAMPVAAMAGDPSRLAGRVARLLESDGRRSIAAAPRWAGLAVAALLLAATLWLPGVSLAGDVTEAPVEVPPPAVAPPATPGPVLAPVPAPLPPPGEIVTPAVAPAAPTAPAIAIPAPGPVPPAPPVAAEMAVAMELAAIEARLAAVDAEATAALAAGAAAPQAPAAVRRVSTDEEEDVDRRREAQRARVEAREQARLTAEERLVAAEAARREAQDRLRARHQEAAEELSRAAEAQRRELERLAEELAVRQGHLREQLGAERQELAAELEAYRQALELQRREQAAEQEGLGEEARRLAGELERRRAEAEALRREELERARDLYSQLASEAEQARGEARRELEERLAPELERLRGDLRLRIEEREQLRDALEERTEEREELRRELEALRRELEALRREGG